MRIIKREISKEEYEQLSKLSYAEQKKKIEDTIPQSWICGYGWYGFSLVGGEHPYIAHRIGNSCD